MRFLVFTLVLLLSASMANACPVMKHRCHPPLRWQVLKRVRCRLATAVFKHRTVKKVVKIDSPPKLKLKCEGGKCQWTLEK